MPHDMARRLLTAGTVISSLATTRNRSDLPSSATGPLLSAWLTSSGLQYLVLAWATGRLCWRYWFNAFSRTPKPFEFGSACFPIIFERAGPTKPWASGLKGLLAAMLFSAVRIGTNWLWRFCARIGRVRRSAALRRKPTSQPEGVVMQAAVLGEKAAEIRDLPKPTPKPNEVLIRVK